MFPPHVGGVGLRLPAPPRIVPRGIAGAARVAAALLIGALAIPLAAVVTGDVMAPIAAAASVACLLSGLPMLRADGARLLGIGLIGIGVALGVVVAGDAAGIDPRRLAGVVVLGLAAAGGAWVPALAGRRWQALDGAGVGLGIMFTVWSLVMTPRGSLASLVFWVAVLSACMLGIAVVAGLSRAAALCALGIGLVIMSMDGLAFSLETPLDADDPVLVPALFCAPLVAAPVLVWRGLGARRPPGPEPSGHTVLIVSAAFAGAVGLARLLVGGDFDRATTVLGIVGLVAVAVREALTARVAARRAREAMEQERRWRDLVDELRATTHLPGELIGRPGALAWIDLHAGLSRRRGVVLVLGGDDLVAQRLAQVVTGSDIPAQLAADRFAVLTEAEPVLAYALAARLADVLGTAVGIAEVAGGADAAIVLGRAELALGRASQLSSTGAGVGVGTGRVEWFDDSLAEAIARRRAMERDLPDAMLRGELDIDYQPVVELAGGTVVAVEALLRWRHPTLGTLRPDEVIPVAEQLGLVAEIDEWVLNRSCRHLARWLRQGRDLSIAVNISPTHLQGLPERVADVLDLHGLAPERLVLEFSDAGLAAIATPEEKVAALRDIGVRTALDDFGTGPASLAHVRGVPVDLVKVGPSFFGGLTPATSTRGPAQPSPLGFEVIVGLGRRLGIDVVAQGLEAPAHLDAVRAAGCRLGQGHLLAKPCPVEHAEALLDGPLGRRRALGGDGG